MAHNQLPEEHEVYVRVAGFPSKKLTIGEILLYLVWYEEGHTPVYVKCPECGNSRIARAQCGDDEKLWRGELNVNCPHANQEADPSQRSVESFGCYGVWVSILKLSSYCSPCQSGRNRDILCIQIDLLGSRS